MRPSIKELHDEMRKLTLESGVSEETYNAALEDPDALDWLRDRHAREYHGVLSIKRLLPDQVWAQYKVMGEHNLREQRLLAEAQTALRRIWRDRYGKKKKANAKTDSGSSPGVSV